MTQMGYLPANQFSCISCGGYHQGLPRAFSVPEPLSWHDPAREATSTLGPEQCRLDLPSGSHYYLRADLELPVHGEGEEPVVLTVWVSLSVESMRDVIRRSDDEERATGDSYFGYFSNELPTHPGSYLIKCRVHMQKPGLRPLLQLEPTEHPLSLDQRRGITAHRAAEIAEAFLAEAEAEH
jgi:hypothetical protein